MVEQSLAFSYPYQCATLHIVLAYTSFLSPFPLTPSLLYSLPSIPSLPLSLPLPSLSSSLKHSWQELGQELCKLADLHSEQVSIMPVRLFVTWLFYIHVQYTGISVGMVRQSIDRCTYCTNKSRLREIYSTTYIHVCG